MSVENQKNRYPLLKNIFPALLTIVLFLVLIFFNILPHIENALMNQKKEAVKRLIEAAYSLVENTYLSYRNGESSEEEAQKFALESLQKLRYDQGMKNYFWVNTIEPDNRAIMIMHPYRGDLVGTDIFDLQDPDGVYMFRDMMKTAKETGEGFSAYRWQYMDNTERIEAKISYVKLFEPWNWIIGTGLYLDDVNRDIKRIVGDVARYILISLALILFLLLYTSYNSIRAEKEKETAENILIDSRRYLTRVVNQLPSALFNCDGDWIVRNCNNRALSLLGRKREKVTDASLADLITGMDGAVGEIRSGVFERRTVEIGGIERIVHMEIFEVDLKDYPRFVVLIDDITTQVQKENQLMQAQKMETVGNLVGGIAHDFNNIIGGIIGTSSLMNMRCQDFESLTREELCGYISLLDEAGERAADMVQHLLSLSRKQEAHYSPLDLRQPVDHIHKMCQSSFDRCIEIRVSAPEEPAMSLANITLIEQVLLNLCINGSHAMTLMREDRTNQGGTLLLKLDKVHVDSGFRKINPEAREDEYWCISVQDTGVGIEKKNLSKIFEPFFTTKDKEHGSGLGLSMVYNIIRQHKGFIDIYSEKDMGTIVKVYLPVLHLDRENLQDTPEKDALVEGSGTVLVIDDDRIIRGFTVEILRKCGYDTLQAEDGEEGLRVFDAHRESVDLVYLDMIMPKKSGAEVFFRLRETAPAVRILLSSGFRKDERVQELMALGVEGFLQKPFSAYDLSRMVHDILA